MSRKNIKPKNKDLKGNFFYVNKLGLDLISREKLSGEELLRMFVRIKSERIENRYMATDDAKVFILVPGDEIAGNANLEIPEQDNNFYYGVFAKLSDADQHFQASEPKENKITINMVDIDLNKKDMVWTFFVIEKETGSILFLDNQKVGPISKFSRYLKTYVAKIPNLDCGTCLEMSDGSEVETIEIIPIATADATKQLLNLDEIGELLISIPGENAPTSGYFSEDICNLAKSGILSIDIKIKAKRGASLNLSDMIPWTQKFGKHSSKLKAKGKNTESLDEVIDFLSPKISVTLNVKVFGNIPDPEDVFYKMKHSFIANRERLNEELKNL